MDQRKELSLINKHIRQHNRESGEAVAWFEFAPLASAASAGSTYDDVYDEGGVGYEEGRKYSASRSVPTIYVAEFEDQFTPKEEGRQTVQTIRAAFLYLDIERAGISSPHDARSHLADIIYYRGRYYKLNDYHVRGHIPDNVVVGIIGFEVYVDQEFGFDPGPAEPLLVDYPWPDTFPTVGV